MKQPYERFQAGRSITIASIAVQLSDEFAPNQMLVGNAAVQLEGVNRASIKNISGCHLFLNLPAGSYKLRVAADYYLDETQTISIDSQTSAPSLLNITLKPNSAYPFPHGTALLRAVVRDQAGQPIRSGDVRASVFQPEDSSKARIGKPAVKGDLSIRLANVQGEIQAEDVLMINDPNRERIEFCRIINPVPAKPNQDTYTLSAPLQYAHSSGGLLYLMRKAGVNTTRTDDRGEFALPFKHVGNHKLFAAVEIYAVGLGRFDRDLEVNEGSLTSLGVIQLSS